MLVFSHLACKRHLNLPYITLHRHNFKELGVFQLINAGKPTYLLLKKHYGNTQQWLYSEIMKTWKWKIKLTLLVNWFLGDWCRVNFPDKSAHLKNLMKSNDVDELENLERRWCRRRRRLKRHSSDLFGFSRIEVFHGNMSWSQNLRTTQDYLTNVD